MAAKKSYTTPQVLRVDLNHEQAILSACSLTATGATNGMMLYCRMVGCKSHHNMNMADSAGRAS